MAGKGGARPGKRTRGPHLKRRGRRWYAYLARGDVRSLDTEDEGLARERFRAIVADRPARAARHAASTIAQIVAAYVTAPHGWTRQGAQTERGRAVYFAEAMAAHGATLPSQITTKVLDAWRSARMAEVARATIARDEACAGRVMAWAVKHELARTNPFTDRAKMPVPSRPKRRVIHSPAQVGRMVSWALAKHRGWALTAATLEATGFRIEEARRMTASWLTVDGVRLEPEAGAAAEAWTSKGFKVRAVTLSAESLDVVRQFLAWRDEPHGKTHKAGVSDRWFATVADRAARALDLPPTYRPHDARRRWVTEALRAGAPLSAVCDAIGHADVATTERYVCTYYDDASTVTAPTTAAVAALARPAGDVLPMRRARGAG